MKNCKLKIWLNWFWYSSALTLWIIIILNISMVISKISDLKRI